MNHFDQRAASWNTDARKARAREAAQAIRAIIGTEKIASALDYGAGTGLLSFELAEQLDHVTLLDTSVGMLQQAKEELRGRGLAWRTEVRDLSRPDPGHPQQGFDLIYSMLTLHHVADTAELLRSFATALRDGGQLVLIDLPPGSEAYHKDAEHHHHDGFEPEVLTEQLRQAGFEPPTWHPPLPVYKTIADGSERRFDLFVLSAVLAP